MLPGGRPSWVPAANQAGTEWDLAALGETLFLTLGCTRVRWQPQGAHRLRGAVLPTREFALRPRRALASGGALYPAEIYLYVRSLNGIASGLYHYDAARHAVKELPGQRCDELLVRVLGLDPTRLPRVAAVVANSFLKNFYKYRDFSYRLGAVDVGIAVGRLQRLAETGLGDARVKFDFDDESLNRIFGLDTPTESAYAALLLGGGFAASVSRGGVPTGTAVRRTPQPRPRSADFDAMHASAVAVLGINGRTGGESPGPRPVVAGAEGGTALPSLPPPTRQELRHAIARRTCNGPLFSGAPVPVGVLADSLSEAGRALGRVRVASLDLGLPSPRLLCIAQRVLGLAPGAYAYDGGNHALRVLREGDLGRDMQAALYSDNLNVDLGAFAIHVIDELDFRPNVRGTRTYRVQQMLVGVACDAVMLSASRWGLGSQPLLGFDAARIDMLYGLEGSAIGVLAHVSVGHARRGRYLEASVAG